MSSSSSRTAHGRHLRRPPRYCPHGRTKCAEAGLRSRPVPDHDFTAPGASILRRSRCRAIPFPILPHATSIFSVSVERTTLDSRLTRTLLYDEPADCAQRVAVHPAARETRPFASICTLQVETAAAIVRLIRSSQRSTLDFAGRRRTAAPPFPCAPDAVIKYCVTRRRLECACGRCVCRTSIPARRCLHLVARTRYKVFGRDTAAPATTRQRVRFLLNTTRHRDVATSRCDHGVLSGALRARGCS